MTKKENESERTAGILTPFTATPNYAELDETLHTLDLQYLAHSTLV